MSARLNWPQQRDKTLRRDSYTCQRCEKTKEELGRYPDVHHIVPAFNFPDPTKAHALTNLLCLCKRCHRAADSFSSLFFPRRDRMSRETEALLAELKRWCDAERGRKASTARALGVPPQLVSDWFGKRKTPTWEQGLGLFRTNRTWRLK
jgi:HNH endonuclease